ncbi:MAG: hypothetical protein D6722_11310 [Bacteroidetes bacterium]|nr:MAG: hypothetical protein D6722_11310 [Bacteroidota bacterium]
MPPVSLHFFGHQPYPLRAASIFDIGSGAPVVDRAASAARTEAQAAGCYRPGLELLERLIEAHGGRFQVAMTLTGPWMEQVTAHAPGLIRQVQRLAKTGQVSWLATPYHHSLSFVADRALFAAEMDRHEARLHGLTGQRPRLCVQPGYLYTNPMAYVLHQRGYVGCLVDGGPAFLKDRSPNWVYHGSHMPGLHLLVRDALHSDDLELRFGMDARAFSARLAARQGEVINLWLSLDWLGSHAHRAFLRDWVRDWLLHPEHSFVRPEDVIAAAGPGAPLDAPDYVSVRGPAHDLSPWLGNTLQKAFFDQLYELAAPVAGRKDLRAEWHALSDAQHLLAMGEPEGRGVSAYSHLMSLFADFHLRV